MFVIAKRENGKLVFSTDPVEHPDRVAAETEAKRLATKHKGTEFEIFARQKSFKIQVVEQMIEK